VKLRPPSPAMVVALLALFVALGGTGYAASHHSAAAKKKKKSSALTVRKVNSLIQTYFNAHKQALIGPRGATGPAGADATKLFAQIRATGGPSIVRGSGVTGVVGPADTGNTGLYNVTFNRDISKCVPVGSGTGPDTNFPGISGVTVNHNDATSVSVQTVDNTNAPSNTVDFTVAVFC
jgi:hypothetical protein